MTAFAALHRGDRPLLLPNAWDFASAAALVDAGFGAVGTTSLGVAAAHGIPDGHGLARAETLALTRLLGRLPCLLTVDIETGFGEDPAEVAGLVAELAGAGAAGINIEDGRADGTLAPVTRQSELIAAIKARVPDLFVNARTDTYWTGPGALDETLARASAYVTAGADGIFVPGVAAAADIRTLVAGVAAPLNVLFLPGRHTLGGLAELGVRRVSCGSLLFRAAIHAAVQTALAVADDLPITTKIPGYAEIQRLSYRSDTVPGCALES